ncbi:MAG: ACT domain-containing protein [Proteobacteria bacterium]|nr:ACT domain-containing protein [Pseudomonadota bacterium]
MAVSGRKEMIAGMAPDLRPGAFVFVTGAEEAMIARAIAMFREAEGLSLVLPAEEAPGAGPRMRLITLQVNSALEGVGLTAAVASALADEGIPANVVAAYMHDHVFVPEAQAEAAIRVLQALARSARG